MYIYGSTVSQYGSMIVHLTSPSSLLAFPPLPPRSSCECFSVTKIQELADAATTAFEDELGTVGSNELKKQWRPYSASFPPQASLVCSSQLTP